MFKLYQMPMNAAKPAGSPGSCLASGHAGPKKVNGKPIPRDNQVPPRQDYFIRKGSPTAWSHTPGRYIWSPAQAPPSPWSPARERGSRTKRNQTPRNLTPRNLIPGNQTPRNLIPGNQTPRNLIPGNLIPLNCDAAYSTTLRVPQWPFAR